MHCGAGVSRSATLLIAYIMRRHGLPLAAALQFCQKRRSVTLPNEGATAGYPNPPRPLSY